MATTIANTAILMSLNAGGLVSGLNKASGYVQSFTSKIMSIGSAFAPIVAILAGGLTVAGIVSWAKSTLEAIDRLDELSQKTGISTEALSRLGYAAKFSGVDMETLSQGLVKMERSLASTNQSGSIYQAIGLDVAKLSAMQPERAFAVIADAINALPNPMDRARASMEIFSKSGADLLPVLALGSKGFQEMGRESDVFGNTIDSISAVKVANAADAIDRLKTVGQGAMNTIIIEIAPYIEALINMITDWLKTTPGVAYGVTEAFQFVAVTIARVADVAKLLEAGFWKLGSVVANAFSSGITGVIAFIEALGTVSSLPIFKKLFGASLSIDTSSLKEFRRVLDTVSAEGDKRASKAFAAFQNGENQGKVLGYFADFRSMVDKAANAMLKARPATNGLKSALDELMANAKKVDDILKSLAESVATFGMSDAEKKMKALTEAMASPKQMAEAQAMIDKLDALNKDKSLTDAATKVIEDLKSPFEKAQDEIDKLDEMLNAGKLSWEQYQEAVDKVNASLDNKPKDIVISQPKAFESNSQETRRLFLDMARGTGVESKEAQILKENIKHTKIMERIADNTEPSSKALALAFSGG